jgi:hypothetical protein
VLDCGDAGVPGAGRTTFDPLPNFGEINCCPELMLVTATGNTLVEELTCWLTVEPVWNWTPLKGIRTG